jgi:acyl-coenzyme A synthetase/AMP-(fatty) acid ligase
VSGPVSFHDLVARHARERPETVFVHSVDQDKALTYGTLRAVADGIAAELCARGLAADDRVLLLADNSVEFHASFVSVLRYGATIATVHLDTHRAHLAEIIAALRPKLVLYQAGLGLEACLGAARERCVELGEWHRGGGSGIFAAAARRDGAAIASRAAPENHGVIFYTSGTVGKPKGVIQTHAAAFYNYDATADYLGLVGGTRVFDCRSFSWLSAQHMALGAPLVAGASAYIARKFSASRYFDWLRRHEIEIGFVVPTMINMLLAAQPAAAVPADLPRLRFLTCSSAPLFLDPWRQFEQRFGITLCQSGGSSEGGNTAAHRRADRKLGTLGPPLKYQQIRIVDEAGRELPQGELGEIIVAGGRQQAFGTIAADGGVEPLPADGHRTGDLGRIDEDGHLVIVGRLKELINRGGVKIAPLEIDAVLHGIPGVAEAAAAGVPDAIYGEEIVGFLAPAAGAALDPDAVLAHCRGNLPEIKAPKAIVFVPDLPKNARGKIDRKALVELWGARKKP